MIAAGAGLAFADFEFEVGFCGGLGNTAAAGLNLQLGYITPQYKVGIEGELAKVRWALLADLGIGYRYGSNGKTYSTIGYDPYYDEYRITKHYYHNGVDYNLGLITELYFLPFMGIAVGGGFAPGHDDLGFIPYARAQIPFLFENVKLGLGFDYIFWKDDGLPQGTTLMPGYRVNLFVHLRGSAAGGLLSFLGWWFN